VDVNERLFLGAEAEIRTEEFLGREVVAKRRLPKAYRHPDLDARLRRERTRLESQILQEVRAAGVTAPAVIDVDVADATVRMARIGGIRLRDALEQEPARIAELCHAFGALVGRLHAAGFVHGDLTTSNVHVDAGRLVLLDFGLAQRSREIEELGVDLHLVERTFESSHPSLSGTFAAFLQGYATTFADATLVERRMNDIKSRARYA
jgi:bifunctional N6-L-threonylcarbamoyladenine synthase / protein kinase Bud32